MFARYKLSVHSRLRTPLHSDTIFGHLCWGIRYHKDHGGEALDTFLRRYDEEKPPILISCAFPEGVVPRPHLPGLPRETLYATAQSIGEKQGFTHRKALYQGLLRLKSMRRRLFISLENWLAVRENLDEQTVLETLPTDDAGDKSEEFVLVVRDHNSISRHDNRVLADGGLYAVEEMWAKHDQKFDLYVRFAREDDKALWETIWREYIEPTGFGKDKSTGAGHLSIEEDVDFTEDLFNLEGANGRMSLSNMALPKWPDDLCGWYKTFCKNGKLGGHFAVHGPEGERPNPFKKSIIMLNPGAVLTGPEPPLRLLDNVHVDPKIRHYGLPLCLPAKMEVGHA